MFCVKCGLELDNTANFCPKCGFKVNTNSPEHSIRLKCQDCGGELAIDEKQEVMCCPYCGSTRKFFVSDEVKIEMIKGQSQVDMIRATGDLAERKWERERINNKDFWKLYRKFVISIIIFLVLILLMTSK